MEQCPCSSGKQYEQCCAPYIEKKIQAPNPEALMRSRYTAFTMADREYIVSSHHPTTRDGIDQPATESWARSAEWQRLEVIRASDCDENATKGVVEFKAYYRVDGKDCILHEISDFVKEKNQWYYLDGHLPAVAQYVRENVKVGRNDPCSCGSGKKYKKCCAA